ncbi:Lipoprotein signal peptidase [uncultured delta proteobacterium]|uniref:Lipoprotein signal peptidase n=1 Tax=uncultured delta proteobacterium TaxID=34034 RepID=A0A212IXA2_9DELT|nr:Lipoprotein signal peptidase [uncultured delta proteobacterium]
MRNRYAIIAAVTALVTLIDQATKVLVLHSIPLYTEIPVIKDFFSLVHVRNRGAAFGFLNRHDISWQFWLFLAATLVAIVVVIMLAKSSRADDYPFFLSLGLILGGAAGNLIDRILYREVIDFLDFYWGTYHWPAFNVADIAICCGAALALIFSLRRSPPAEKTGR